MAERLENYGLKPEVLYLTKLGCAEIIPTAARFIAAMLIIAVMLTFLESAYQLRYIYRYSLCSRIVPTKFEVHEWEIMQNFSRSVESDSIREDLLNAIHGPGAFRNFKDTRFGGTGSNPPGLHSARRP